MSNREVLVRLGSLDVGKPLLPPSLPPSTDDDPWLPATLLIVQAAIFLAGFDLELVAGVSATFALVAATTPIWWQILRTFSWARLILFLVGASVVCGLYLAELSRDDHVISRSLQITSITHILNGVAIIVALLWGRVHLPLYWVATLFGTGALADALLNSPRSWKFNLAVPATIAVVGWLGRYRNRLPTVVVLVLFGLIGVLDEGRSYFAFCLAAAALVVWQMRPDAGQSVSRWYPALLLLGIGATIYGVVSSLLTGGYFGPTLQQRSIEQIDASGSLISGGRPEWAATRALMQFRPRGYGVGTVPNLSDHRIAEAGLASINVDTGGYLTNYMLGGQFRLHSVTSDLWLSFGVVGLALAAIIVFTLIRSLSTLTALRRAPAVTLFGVVLALWHMAFGPIFSNWPDVCFALGISLLSVGADHDDEPVSPISEPRSDWRLRL